MVATRFCIALAAMLVLGGCGAAASSSGGQPAGILETRVADPHPADWDMLDASTDPAALQRATETAPSGDICDVAGCVTRY